MIDLFRRNSKPQPPVRALILGGGGARGAYEAGVVAALTERESFDIICGTSIGAVNGMLVAQGMADQLHAMWSTISARGVTSLRPELAALLLMWQAAQGMFNSPLHRKHEHLMPLLRALPALTLAAGVPRILGLFEGGNVRAVIKELADLERVDRAFICGVTNLSSGRGEAFAYFPPTMAAAEAAFHQAEIAEPIHAANYVEAICASAALPPIYEPVPILCRDQVVRAFADGGFTNNTPIRQAIDAGATDITAVLVDSEGARGDARTLGTIADVASVMLEANSERMLQLDLKLARRINDDVLAGRSRGKRYVSFRVIGPTGRIALPPMGFDDQRELDRLFALGYDDGRQSSVA